jgi:hypothetical protein
MNSTSNIAASTMLVGCSASSSAFHQSSSSNSSNTTIEMYDIPRASRNVETACRQTNKTLMMNGTATGTRTPTPTRTTSSSGTATATTTATSSIPFPIKLRSILQASPNEGLTHIISWQMGGTAFRVHQPDTFVQQVMWKWFNQTKYKSFQRVRAFVRSLNIRTLVGGDTARVYGPFNSLLFPSHSLSILAIELVWIFSHYSRSSKGMLCAREIPTRSARFTPRRCPQKSHHGRGRLQ